MKYRDSLKLFPNRYHLARTLGFPDFDENSFSPTMLNIYSLYNENKEQTITCSDKGYSLPLEQSSRGPFGGFLCAEAACVTD